MHASEQYTNVSFTVRFYFLAKNTLVQQLTFFQQRSIKLNNLKLTCKCLSSVRNSCLRN